MERTGVTHTQETVIAQLLWLEEESKARKTHTLCQTFTEKLA